MKISIITTSYNYAQYIEEAINSVIHQTYQDWELIIVDDGSSDNSVEIIKNFCEKDKRIKFFQHENSQNKGLKESILLGLKNTKGEWVAFLESDDYFAPDNLAKKVEIIKQHDKIKLIFNKVAFLSEEKRRQQKYYENTQKKLSQMQFPKNLFYDFYIDNIILTFSCVMVEASALKNADFNTLMDNSFKNCSLRHCENGACPELVSGKQSCLTSTKNKLNNRVWDSTLDRWLWIHLAYDKDFYYVDEELTYWRLHPKSYITESKKPILYFPQVAAYWDVYKQNGKPSKLFLFLLFSAIKLFFVKIYRKCKTLSQN